MAIPNVQKVSNTAPTIKISDKINPVISSKTFADTNKQHNIKKTGPSANPYIGSNIDIKV